MPNTGVVWSGNGTDHYSTSSQLLFGSCQGIPAISRESHRCVRNADPHHPSPTYQRRVFSQLVTMTTMALSSALNSSLSVCVPKYRLQRASPALRTALRVRAAPKEVVASAELSFEPFEEVRPPSPLPQVGPSWPLGQWTRSYLQVCSVISRTSLRMRWDYCAGEGRARRGVGGSRQPVLRALGLPSGVRGSRE